MSRESNSLLFSLQIEENEVFHQQKWMSCTLFICDRGRLLWSFQICNHNNENRNCVSIDLIRLQNSSDCTLDVDREKSIFDKGQFTANISESLTWLRKTEMKTKRKRKKSLEHDDVMVVMMTEVFSFTFRGSAKTSLTRNESESNDFNSCSRCIPEIWDLLCLSNLTFRSGFFFFWLK